MSLRMFAQKALKLIIIFAANIFFFFVFIIFGYPAYQRIFYGPTEFNSEVWRNGDNYEFSSDAPRLRMADAIIDSGVLIGKTKVEVDNMLGPQTNTDYFRPQYKYVYWLGAERGWMSIDSEWLVLNFGSDGTVSEARIVRD